MYMMMSSCRPILNISRIDFFYNSELDTFSGILYYDLNLQNKDIKIYIYIYICLIKMHSYFKLYFCINILIKIRIYL